MNHALEVGEEIGGIVLLKLDLNPTDLTVQPCEQFENRLHQSLRDHENMEYILKLII